MDYLIAQLKKHGIYTNINLKVVRQFQPEDGLPASVKQVPWASKRVDYFNERMIALQKEYARDLLTHVNPYTQTAYAAEPAIVSIEINNENSLTESDEGQALLSLPEPFRGELQTLWNVWMAKAYKATEALRTAWYGSSGSAPGAQMLQGADRPERWKLERHDPVKATLTADSGALKVAVADADGVGWHAQVMQTGLALEEGKTYTLRFRARADAPRPVTVNLSRDVPDWRKIGLSQSVALTTEWQEFEFVVRAREVLPGHTRLTFELGEKSGTVWLSDISLRPGASPRPLAAGQTLEAKTIPLPVTRVGRQRADWLRFLADTELAYARRMRKFLKERLGVRSMVIDTQTSYGIHTGPYREREMDYIDIHAYWDHVQQRPGQWDPVGGYINNNPMTPVIGTSDTLTWMAKHRQADRPHVISEYNQGPPNEYAVEAVPLLASIAAWQDWDAIYLHEYGDYGPNAKTDRIQAYFAVASDPNKWAFLPSAALIFRAGATPSASRLSTATMPATLTVPEDEADRTVNAAWDEKRTAGTILDSRLALTFGGKTTTDRASPAPAAAEHAASLQVKRAGEEQAVYTADAPEAKVVTGHVAKRTVRLKDAEFTFGDAPNGFAALTLAAMDDRPLPESGKALLTVIARVTNTDQKWQPDRHRLESWGTGPTLADGIRVQVALRISDGNRKVFALDNTGAKKQEVPAKVENGLLRFTIDPAHQTLWYAIMK